MSAERKQTRKVTNCNVIVKSLSPLGYNGPMSDGLKIGLKFFGIGVGYGIAFFVAYGNQNLQAFLPVAALAAYVGSAWAISSLLLTKWQQPERTFGMLGFAPVLTWAETLPPFWFAADSCGV